MKKMWNTESEEHQDRCQYRNLLSEIIAVSLNDIKTFSELESQKITTLSFKFEIIRRYYQAFFWFANLDEAKVFSFGYTCRELGLDPEVIIDKISDTLTKAINFEEQLQDSLRTAYSICNDCFIVDFWASTCGRRPLRADMRLKLQHIANVKIKDTNTAKWLAIDNFEVPDQVGLDPFKRRKFKIDFPCLPNFSTKIFSGYVYKDMFFRKNSSYSELDTTHIKNKIRKDYVRLCL